MNTNTLKNNPLSRSFLKLACAVALLGAISSTAYATPITGEIGYSGGVADLLGGGTGTIGSASGGYTLGTATGIDFTGVGFVSGGTGAFAALAGGFLSLSDFMFAPLDPAPSALVWTDLTGGTGLSFSLDTVSVVTQTDAGFGQLTLAGSGVMTGTGYVATDYNWTLTAQNAPTGTLVTFSATQAVPEPGMLALMGFGLLALSLTGRAKRRKVARS